MGWSTTWAATALSRCNPFRAEGSAMMHGMTDLAAVAPAFVEMAHRIVWATVATVDPEERPRSRILHPIWEWDGESLTGWIGTGPTPVKRAHLDHSPYMSVNYWAPNHDTCVAECRAG